MSKGIIVIEIPDMPEDCYHCAEVDNESGYCKHVGRFIDHFVKEGERYPTCPIKPMPEKDNKNYFPDEFLDGMATGWNACIDEILEGAE